MHGTKKKRNKVRFRYITFLFKFRIMFFGSISIFRGFSSPSKQVIFCLPNDRVVKKSPAWWPPKTQVRGHGSNTNISTCFAQLCGTLVKRFVFNELPVFKASLKLRCSIHFRPLRMGFLLEDYVYISVYIIYNSPLGLALFSGANLLSFREGRSTRQSNLHLLRWTVWKMTCFFGGVSKCRTSGGGILDV